MMPSPNTLRLAPKFIDKEALSIVKTLQRHGHTTYLVGGCVRDLLIGIAPKDYDISTMATPQQVRKLLPYAFIIGRRFRLVLVKHGNKEFEVSTFRRNLTPEELENKIGDNVFGDPKSDAARRDFTINGLFYDPSKDKLIDYCQGKSDLKKRLIRMIGDPVTRLQEDPIRIMRALRLSYKISFTLESNLRNAIKATTKNLSTSPLPRKREEFLKWLHLKEPSLVLIEAGDLGALKVIAPTLHQALEQNSSFLQNLKGIESHGPLDKDTHSLFFLYVWPFIKTILPPLDDITTFPAKNLESNKSLRNLMSSELGLFKSEQKRLLQAVEMLFLLRKTPFFARKPKTLSSIVNHPSFRLALYLAKAECFLGPEDFHMWQKAYYNLSSIAANLDRTTQPMRKHLQHSKENS